MNTYGAHAIIATSGMSRAPSAGTPSPVCQVGFGKIALAPPPLAFHALSTPPEPTSTSLMSLPDELNCGLKVVPPTAVTCGLAAISLAFLTVPVTQAPPEYCRPAAPQSPEAMKTDCPWVAAS
jgi:hypothetical protein